MSLYSNSLFVFFDCLLLSLGTVVVSKKLKTKPKKLSNCVRSYSTGYSMGHFVVFAK